MFSRIFFSSFSLRKRNIDINENKWRIIRSEKPRQISYRTRGKWQKLVNFPIASTEILESTILPAPKADNARWKKRGNEVLTRSTGGCASHVENDKWGISIPRIPEEEDSVSKDVFVCLFIYLFMQRIKASTSITPPRFLHFLLLLFSPAEICSTMTRARADR